MMLANRVVTTVVQKVQVPEEVDSGFNRKWSQPEC